MGEWLLSRRDRLIVARHEVPGFSLQYSNRPIGAHTCTNQTVPYGTALFGGGAAPRHFVPGYYRTVAPGLFATGFT